MAGEIQLNSTTFATESGGTVTIANVDSATNRTNLGLGSIATQASDSIDINGGAIDGATIGGTSAAAGTFTTFTSTGIDDNASSTALTIDSSGNCGIGTSSPSSKLHLSSANPVVTLTDTDTSVTHKINADSSVGQLIIDVDSTSAGSDRRLLINVGGSERMRIDSSGNVGIGMNSPSGKGLVAAVTRSDTLGQITAYYNSTYAWKIGTYSSGTFVIYADDTGSPGVYLNWRGTSWNANSDERLKTNLLPIENAVEKLCSLRTVTGRYLIDDESVSRSFLIAQDFQEVFPEPLSESPDGFLGLSYTDVIPLMIAGFKEQQALIQSQQSQIDALTARIEALETA